MNLKRHSASSINTAFAQGRLLVAFGVAAAPPAASPAAEGVGAAAAPAPIDGIAALARRDTAMPVPAAAAAAVAGAAAASGVAAAGVSTVDVEARGVRAATEVADRHLLGLEAGVLDRQRKGRGRERERDCYQIPRTVLLY